MASGQTGQFLFDTIQRISNHSFSTNMSSNINRIYFNSMATVWDWFPMRSTCSLIVLLFWPDSLPPWSWNGDRMNDLLMGKNHFWMSSAHNVLNVSLFSYVRAEVLAGFVNGLFLVFIAFFIFSEAVERLFEPPEVKHERLFIISVLGLLVNLVGIFVFQHGGGHHGHSHGGEEGHGHSHGSSAKHSHSNNHSSPNQFHGNALLNQLPGSNAFVDMNNHGHSHAGAHNHSHDGGHGHSHNGGPSHISDSKPVQSQILQGVFLHILADTLGSVGVIISALLMSNFGWMIADPICSMFIAIMVALSVYPLLRDSIHVIMQRTPKEIEDKLNDTIERVINYCLTG